MISNTINAMTEIKLEDLGFNEQLEKFRVEHQINETGIARVIAEHKERYIVKTLQGEYDAEITGNMRFSAETREDFPAVGDWVGITPYDTEFAIIQTIFPRFSVLKRQAVAQSGEIQMIAANIDVAFLVQAVDRDFNLNRLERYLTICYSSNVKPIIVLSKIDLTDELRLKDILNHIQTRIPNVPVITISNVTENGYDMINQCIERGKTYCLLGSSGVGKSTLLNNLAGRTVMKTDIISSSTNKGRHVTSHRELIILENGGILIDNPGMREVGIADLADGLEKTFDMIASLSQNCRYKDCTHTGEAGCSVLDAVEKGEIEEALYQNYLKMERERAHFESTVVEKRKKDKAFGKMLKNYKKDMRNNDQY